MDNLTILLIGFGVPAGILLVWYAFHKIRDRLRWARMWVDLRDIADKDEGRERWHQFLRDEGCEDKIALPKVEEMFQGMWKDTRDERKE